MDTLSFRRSPWIGLFVAAVLLLAARPARAAAAPEPAGVTAAAPAFAEVSIKQFFTSSNSRDRIIQLCVLCMMLALFILLKKFVADPAPQRGTRSAERGTPVDSEFRAPRSEFRAEPNPSRKS
jgi:hypothetical protein